MRRKTHLRSVYHTRPEARSSSREPFETQPLPDTPRLKPSIAPTDGWSRAGLVGLYVFVFFGLLGITPATVGLVLLTLAFLIRFDGWRRLARDPVALLALAFGLYVAMHSSIAYFLEPTPTLAQAVVDNGTDWLKLLLFIPLAYWAAGRPDRVRLLLLLCLAGFTLATFRKVDWASFDATFFSTRFESYLPAIAFGMFAGLGALGLLATRRAFWAMRDRPWQRWLAATLWAVWLLIMLEGLLLSQSRGSWLGFLGGLAVLMLLEWRTRQATTARPARRRWLAILSGRRRPRGHPVEPVSDHRDAAHRPDRHPAAGDEWRCDRGDLRPCRPARQRTALHRREMARTPLVRLGCGHQPRMDRRQRANGHPHGQRQLAAASAQRLCRDLFQFGSIGLLLAVALVWALVRSTGNECRAGRIPVDLCRLFLVTLVFVLIWNLFNYRVVRSDWMVFSILLAGSAYSFRLARLTKPAGDERG
jgi:O-antigen ligase